MARFCSGVRNSRLRPLGKPNRPWHRTRAQRHPGMERTKPGRPGRHTAWCRCSRLDRTPGEVCGQGFLQRHSPPSFIIISPDPCGSSNGPCGYGVVWCVLRSLRTTWLQVEKFRPPLIWNLKLSTSGLITWQHTTTQPPHRSWWWSSKISVKGDKIPVF